MFLMHIQPAHFKLLGCGQTFRQLQTSDICRLSALSAVTAVEALAVWENTVAALACVKHMFISILFLWGDLPKSAQ